MLDEKTRYTPDAPCNHGHRAERYIEGNVCVECRRITVAKRRDKTVESRRTQQAAWRNRNLRVVRAHDRQRSRKTYEENPEKVKKVNAAWWRNNPDKRRAYKASRRARELGASGFYTPNDIDSLLSRQSGTCAAPHCDSDLHVGYHVDHVVALMSGGTNWPNNLQLLCPSCNCSKGAKGYEAWCEEKINATC